MVRTQANWLRLCCRMLALFTARHGDCAVTFAGYMERLMPRIAPPIVFIAKLKPCTPAFGFFDRKTGCIIANRVGRLAEIVVSLLANRIDAVFQAVIIRPWEGHGPS
jgi:hypothetical protein